MLPNRDTYAVMPDLGWEGSVLAVDTGDGDRT